ncbi:hypothetical protein FMM05_19520 [Flavobacterium zepuense]|uniref:ABC-three component systems C-terminal domain-containing protein n=1 Tax=Flavobacterium zepuense TaxID=2593302 RepID=A0A552UUV6_9FLAO|nr:ABC-three component system protein [Flavobacterium zepuense]TRW21977.1 hypothetical protein FMM05_19520 [Flavobacterium zepuense]
MSRNATSSWSGYAHQGKIGLLIALRKINALSGTGANLDEYFLEYETQEDVKLAHNNNILEVHQVKAYRDSSTIGKYTEALEDFEGCAGFNYLHTICNITNWANLTVAQNPSSVVRYPYAAGTNYCSLDDIYGYIDAEIITLLQNLGHQQSDNGGWRKNVYEEFLATLDEKIRVEHQNQNAQTYNIRFSLREVDNIVVTAPTKYKSKLWDIRKKLYGEYLLFLEHQDINQIQLTPVHEQNVKIAIEAIYALDDKLFVQFLYNINPHTTENKVFEHCVSTDDFFVATSFFGTFLQTLVLVTASQYKMDARAIMSYFKNCGYLITSIEAVPYMMQLYASRILDNDAVNYSGYENDYIINQNYDGRLIDCASKIISKRPNKLISKKDMEFISLANAVNILNN